MRKEDFVDWNLRPVRWRDCDSEAKLWESAILVPAKNETKTKLILKLLVGAQ